MKRFLIFLFLFPALATVAFYAVIYLLTRAEVDSVSRPALLYLVFIGPGFLLALVDWLVAAKLKIPGVMGTTIFIYALSLLALSLLLGNSSANLALGLVCAIPAAICSWFSRA